MYKTVFNPFFHITLKCKVHIHSLQGSADHHLMAFSAYIRPLSTSPSLKHFFNLAWVWIVWCNNRSCFPQLKIFFCFYLFFVLIFFCFLAHLFQLFWCEFQLKQHLGGIHTSKKRMYGGIGMSRNIEKITSSMFGPLPNIFSSLNWPILWNRLTSNVELIFHLVTLYNSLDSLVSTVHF